MEQIFVRQNRKGAKASPAQLIFNGRFGNRVYLTLKANGLSLGIGGSAAPLATELRRLADKIDGEVRHWQLEAGQAKPITAPALQVPHRDSWEWLTPEYVIEYFERSPQLSAMVTDVRAVLEPLCLGSIASNGDTTENGEAGSADLQKLLPIREELLDEQGNIRYGAKSRIARELGVRTSGHDYYTRVLPAVEVLQASYSTSTAQITDGEAKNEQYAA